jgi:hypothetical protein
LFKAIVKFRVFVPVVKEVAKAMLLLLLLQKWRMVYFEEVVEDRVEEGSVREMEAELEGERYPIFLPTGVQSLEEQVMSVLLPEKVNAVEG